MMSVVLSPRCYAATSRAAPRRRAAPRCVPRAHASRPPHTPHTPRTQPCALRTHPPQRPPNPTPRTAHPHPHMRTCRTPRTPPHMPHMPRMPRRRPSRGSSTPSSSSRWARGPRACSTCASATDCRRSSRRRGASAPGCSPRCARCRWRCSTSARHLQDRNLVVNELFLEDGQLRAPPTLRLSAEAAGQLARTQRRLRPRVLEIARSRAVRLQGPRAREAACSRGRRSPSRCGLPSRQ